MNLMQYIEKQIYPGIDDHRARRSEVKKISKELGIAESTIYSWLNGTRSVSLKNAIAINKYTDGQVEISKLKPELKGFVG